MIQNKKKTVKPKNSTLAIDAETSERLDFFCRKYEITKKDFIALALGYFERTGVDINSNDIITDLHDINSKIDAIMKLQADATMKLTNIQQSTNILTEVKEDTTKLIEQKNQKGLFKIFRKK